MSGRAENPFDPPQPLDSNPFENPSSSHLAAATDPNNPFSHPNDTTYSLDLQDDASRGRGAPAGYEGDYAKRQAELAAAEERIRAREAAVNAREEDLGMRENNWPPFFPMIHHKIESMPSAHRQTGRLLYIQWLALAITLIINLLGCIFLLIAGSSEGGADTAAAGGYVPVIGALSFLLWYRPIYLGLKKEEGRAMAFFFYIYFLFAGFHLLFSTYMAVGIPSTGSAGLINTISMFSQHHWLAAIFGLISSIGWVLQAAGGGILYKKVWDYKNGNADINFQMATSQFKQSSIKTILMHQGRM